jgi:methylglutaconyl-CoA hydratase
MKNTTLDVAINEGVATIALNRSEVHNAMNDILIEELRSCIQNLGDDNRVRVIIITGKGKSFCGGADLNWMKSMASYSMEDNIRDSNTLLSLFDAIDECPKLVIGRINGHAFGGGLGIIAVCDIAIAANGLTFAFSESKLGLIPSVISTYVIRRIGPVKARHLFMTGERFTSEYAKEIGLIDFAVNREALDLTVQKYVEEIMSSGPLAVSEAKRLIKTHQEMDLEAYKNFTVQTIARLRVSKEGQEGTGAFLEKRKPKWRK